MGVCVDGGEGSHLHRRRRRRRRRRDVNLHGRRPLAQPDAPLVAPRLRCLDLHRPRPIHCRVIRLTRGLFRIWQCERPGLQQLPQHLSADSAVSVSRH